MHCRRLISSCRRIKELSLLSRSTMASSSSTQKDHLERTAHSTRHEIISPASIISIKDESDTVKSLILKIHNKDFVFKAGQWIDCFIPGIEKVTGFSMCSSPGRLQKQGVMELAVKYSSEPPAHWVHTKCKVGEQVKLKAGGDFYFDPQPGEARCNLLLVAGGVGINPLYSIISHVNDLTGSSDENSDEELYNPGQVLLLYSAKEEQELLFKHHIDELCKKNGKIVAKYFVTAKEPEVKLNITHGRIQEENIQDAVKQLQDKNLQVFLCGPSPMIENIEKYLLRCDIAKDKIHYERWW